MSQPSFSRFNFKIKLNVDSTSISKKNVTLLVMEMEHIF